MANEPDEQEHVEPPATRQGAQLKLIQDELPDVGVDPPDWERTQDVRYLYREGSVLVRDRDLERVIAVFETRDVAESEGRIIGGLISGLTRYVHPEVQNPVLPSTLAALRLVDDAVGVGVATPDHVLYVSDETGVSPCPATEPEEVPGTAEPDPRVSTDRCDGQGVLVSVVDTGLNKAEAQAHAWLAGVDGDSEIVFLPDGTIRPYAGHGTFIAGVVRSMAPKAEVYVDGVFTHAGATYESELVPQLDQALSRNPDILSLSAGTPTRRDLTLLGFDVLFEERLRDRKGFLLVAAAGNGGERRQLWPAAFPWVLSVGGLSANWRSRATFSNYGSGVDVYAPATDLVNAYATGRFVCNEPPHANEAREFQGMARWSGTSFSTPLVAGLIAARMSGTGESPRQAADALLAVALRQAVPGVGPVLLPGQACGVHDDGRGGCSCRHSGHCCCSAR
jgi:hypothetical protein